MQGVCAALNRDTSHLCSSVHHIDLFCSICNTMDVCRWLCRAVQTEWSGSGFADVWSCETNKDPWKLCQIPDPGRRDFYPHGFWQFLSGNWLRHPDMSIFIRTMPQAYEKEPNFSATWQVRYGYVWAEICTNIVYNCEYLCNISRVCLGNLFGSNLGWCTFYPHTDQAKCWPCDFYPHFCLTHFLKIFNSYPQTPEGVSKICPVFIRTGLRHLVEISGVLAADDQHWPCVVVPGTDVDSPRLWWN